MLLQCKCRQCGSVFFPKEGKVRGAKGGKLRFYSYCSRKCVGASKRVAIGTEKVLKTAKGNLEWFVAVPVSKSRTVQKTPRYVDWKRKAVIVVETLIGRKLSSHNEHHIQFADGDTLNCNPSNLYILSQSVFEQCDICGASFSRRPSVSVSVRKERYDRNATPRCRKCSYVNNPRNPKLSYSQVSLIKSLTGWVTREGQHRQKLSKRSTGSWFLVTDSTISGIVQGKSWKWVKPMAKSQVWKALLAQHDKLVQQSGVALHDRVTLLARVFEDAEFQSAMAKDGKLPAKELDVRVSDTCANFTELLQILRLFPTRKQWSSGNLSDMRLKMLDKLRADQAERKAKNPAKSKKDKAIDGKPGTRNTVTVREYKELEQKTEKTETEVENLRKQLGMANGYIKTLEAQLEAARETIGSLNETISMFKLARNSKSTVKTK